MRVRLLPLPLSARALAATAALTLLGGCQRETIVKTVQSWGDSGVYFYDPNATPGLVLDSGGGTGGGGGGGDDGRLDSSDLTGVLMVGDASLRFEAGGSNDTCVGPVEFGVDGDIVRAVFRCDFGRDLSSYNPLDGSFDGGLEGSIASGEIISDLFDAPASGPGSDQEVTLTVETEVNLGGTTYAVQGTLSASAGPGPD